MRELFPPDPKKEADGVRFACTITDREPIIFREPGTKRYQQILEDFSLGIRITAEGDTLEEVEKLCKQEQCNILN